MVAWPESKRRLSEGISSEARIPGQVWEDGSVPGMRKGIGFQQVAHSEECRARIMQKLDEDEKVEKEKHKRQREEDAEVERRLKAREEDVPVGGASSSSTARPAPVVEVPDAEVAEPSGEGGKRKAGEDGVQDIEDLAREVEADLQQDIQHESLMALEAMMQSFEAAQIIASIGAMDVVELFSPERVNREVERFGLRRGVAIDLQEMKPDGSRHWDLDLEEDYVEVLHLIAMEQPTLVISSPPCTTFCPLRRITKGERDPKVVESEEELGMERLRRSIQCCELQESQGGYFLHERPKDASSWKTEEMKEFVNRPGHYLVQSPMCRFGMKAKDDDGVEGYVRKETLWLTNSKEIAAELEGVCENKLKGKEIHRHVRLIGGQRAHAAQVYPVALVEAILRGLKKEMKKNYQLNAVEEMFTGPSPDDAVEWDKMMDEHFDEIYMDDSSGAILDPELVRKARAEELAWLKKECVYERVPLSQAKGDLLKIKWLDINKGDHDNPKVRSRLVAKEIKKAKPKEMQLEGADTFSSTPPVETVFALFSLFMTEEKGMDKKMMGTWDISRAHFMGTAAREIYMTLPPEDEVHEEDTEPMVGRLLRSMYGAQDASKIFQEDYQNWLGARGAEFCPLCPSIFRIKQQGLRELVHGDDFLVVGCKKGLEWFDVELNKRYTARWESLLGEGAEKNEAFFLNRLVRFIPDGADSEGCRLEVEADARHADIIVKAFNLQDGGKGCDVPEEKMTEKDVVTGEKQPQLEGPRASQFRSLVMRLAYMSVDRPDLNHVVRTLASAMRTPKLDDWNRLKKVARYLVKYPYLKRVYKMQNGEGLKVVVMSDSDWAGDLRTRRSTSGAVVKVGEHTVQVKCSSQKVVALSSMESEYYAMCRAATQGIFIHNIVDFWEMALGIMTLKVDSSSAKALAERRGVGKTRHVQARFLWLQDRVFNKEMNVAKVNGKVNDPDLVTKVQPKAAIQEHLARMFFQWSGRQGHKKLT